MLPLSNLLILLVSTVILDSVSGQCKCGLEQFDSRIIGGRHVRPGQYPWVVGIGVPDVDGRNYCSGSLINDRYVLTAAHCFQVPHPEKAIVVLGAYKLSEIDSKKSAAAVQEIIIHPDYSAKGHVNDLALIKLAKPVKFSKTVQPVCLASEYTPIDNLFLTGWGLIKSVQDGGEMSRYLNEIELPVLSDTFCQKEWMYRSARVDIAKQMCAGVKGRSSCQGDSGGPLATRTAGRVFQVGIVSYGTVDCGQSTGKPSVYTRVSGYRDWIDSQTRDSEKCF
ncbi:Plasma kallikrein [Halotydeus destructor]|nr:Plasma kallikrein [Halotydeus destructor]